jgi:hypothetical protein
MNGASHISEPTKHKQLNNRKNAKKGEISDPSVELEARSVLDPMRHHTSLPLEIPPPSALSTRDPPPLSATAEGVLEVKTGTSENYCQWKICK